eukprot:32794_1
MSTLFILHALFSASLIDVLSTCQHSSDERYLCMALDSLVISGSISYDIELGSNTYSYPYYHPSYTSCFQITDDILKSCHAIYQDGIATNQSLCMYHIDTIAPVGFPKQTLRVPYNNRIGEYGAFTVYTSNALCVTITHASMVYSDEYYVTGSFYKLDGDLDRIQFITHSSQRTANPQWNQIICLPGIQSNATTQIGIDVRIVSNARMSATHTQVIERTSEESMSISFEDTSTLHLLYWESCGSASRLYRMQQIQNEITDINLTFLSWLIMIAVCTILVVLVLSCVVFKHSDPINYYAIIWVVLELWDFEADIGFTIYLYYFYIIYGDNTVLMLFVAAAFFVIIPYISNLSYLANLVRMWTQRDAAGSSKDWLMNKCGAKILLFVCLSCGGVHPALEICNSLLFPVTIFAMHLPYAEHVRIRTERFLTNVAFENFPFILIEIWFYILLNKSDDEGIKSLKSSNYVFWGGVSSSLLSVVFSATYYFSFRHQQAIPETDYKFAFELRSDVLKKTWIHSHWRLQVVISKLFQVPSPILIIIDECSNIQPGSQFASKRMRVEGRILKDRSASDTSNLNIKPIMSYENTTMMERKNCLLQLVMDAFDLQEDELGVHDVTIDRIATQKVFDLQKANTIKWICCWCTYCLRMNEPEFKRKESDEFSLWSVPSGVWGRLSKISKAPPSIHAPAASQTTTL